MNVTQPNRSWPVVSAPPASQSEGFSRLPLQENSVHVCAPIFFPPGGLQHLWGYLPPPQPAVGWTSTTTAKTMYLCVLILSPRWFATPQGDLPPTQPAVGWTNAMTAAGCPEPRLCYWTAVKATLREVSIHLSDLPGEHVCEVP